jgi:hypothetical protein
MVLIPASTSCFALAGPIPDTRVSRLIAVLVSSSRILKKLNDLLVVKHRRIRCDSKNCKQQPVPDVITYCYCKCMN